MPSLVWVFTWKFHYDNSTTDTHACRAYTLTMFLTDAVTNASMEAEFSEGFVLQILAGHEPRSSSHQGRQRQSLAQFGDRRRYRWRHTWLPILPKTSCPMEILQAITTGLLE